MKRAVLLDRNARLICQFPSYLFFFFLLQILFKFPSRFYYTFHFYIYVPVRIFVRKCIFLFVLDFPYIYVCQYIKQCVIYFRIVSLFTFRYLVDGIKFSWNLTLKEYIKKYTCEEAKGKGGWNFPSNRHRLRHEFEYLRGYVNGCIFVEYDRYFM